MRGYLFLLLPERSGLDAQRASQLAQGSRIDVRIALLETHDGRTCDPCKFGEIGLGESAPKSQLAQPGQARHELFDRRRIEVWQEFAQCNGLVLCHCPILVVRVSYVQYTLGMQRFPESARLAGRDLVTVKLGDGTLRQGQLLVERGDKIVVEYLSPAGIFQCRTLKRRQIVLVRED